MTQIEDGVGATLRDEERTDDLVGFARYLVSALHAGESDVDEAVAALRDLAEHDTVALRNASRAALYVADGEAASELLLSASAPRSFAA